MNFYDKKADVESICKPLGFDITQHFVERSIQRNIKNEEIENILKRGKCFEFFYPKKRHLKETFYVLGTLCIVCKRPRLITVFNIDCAKPFEYIFKKAKNCSSFLFEYC